VALPQRKKFTSTSGNDSLANSSTSWSTGIAAGRRSGKKVLTTKPVPNTPSVVPPKANQRRNFIVILAFSPIFCFKTVFYTRVLSVGKKNRSPIAKTKFDELS
jgi:hypothetical protein